MNQPSIIENLILQFKEASRVLDMTSRGNYLTSGWLLEHGIFSCYTCGHLNNIESEYCGKCHDEKFVVREEDKPKLRPRVKSVPGPPMVYSPKSILRPYNCSVRVVDRETDIKYTSIRTAARATKIPYTTLRDMLKGRVENKTTLELL